MVRAATRKGSLMGYLVYGTAPNAVTVNIEDTRMLRIFELAITRAIDLRRPFRIRLRTSEFEDSAFITDGVFVRVHYDVSEDLVDDLSESEQKILDVLTEGIEQYGVLPIVESGTTPLTVEEP